LSTVHFSSDYKIFFPKDVKLLTKAVDTTHQSKSEERSKESEQGATSVNNMHHGLHLERVKGCLAQNNAS